MGLIWHISGGRDCAVDRLKVAPELSAPAATLSLLLYISVLFNYNYLMIHDN